MDRNNKNHFHIRWSNGRLDWERFSTRAEAEASAKELARSGETYTIEEFDGTCVRCAERHIRKAINDGSKKRDYSGIKVPVLAFFAVDAIKDGWSQYYRFRPTNDEELAALENIFAADRKYLDQYEQLMRSGVPNAHIVELPGAGHYVFFTSEADVLREMRAFVAGLN